MKINISEDFNLKKIADSGQCFRWKMESENTCRVVAHSRILHLTQATNRHTLILDCDAADFSVLWQPYLDLDTDYRAIRAAIPSDDIFLTTAAERGKGIRILRQDPWETLITFIISQRKSIPAIKTAVEALAQAAGSPITSPAGETDFAFPTAQQIAAMDGDALAACSLGYREKYIRSVAARFAAEDDPIGRLVTLPDEALRQELIALPGVGPKVAACVMLFGFHRLDAFPRDVWMNRALADYYAKGYPAEAYAPYNGVMQQYIFAYYREQATAPSFSGRRTRP